jgi:sirohydrochlorin cobaltochelatase
VIVAPLLLFAAGHAKRDIPAALAAAATRHAHVNFHRLDPLGCDDAVVRLSAQRYQQAATREPRVPASETALLMVGRGSEDREAQAEMRRFARLRAERTPVERVSVAFLAMAEPTLEDALHQLAVKRHRRIVVQPHLLFHGDLLTRCREAIQRRTAQHPETQWVLAPHLGPSIELALAVLRRARTILRAIAPASHD